MPQENTGSVVSKRLKQAADVSNILVLIGCLVIIIMISLEILYPQIYAYNPFFLKIQLWICVIFLIDFFLRLMASRNKWHYIRNNLIFFLVSIPYVNIVTYFDVSISQPLHYFLRSVLLLRGGYGLIVVVSWITTSKLTNLFVSYLVILVAITYFSSLMFYSLENKVNEGVKSFWDALWWACMDVTTVGSNITPMTSWGRVIAVTLALLGMCMFPILTAYITGKFQTAHFSALISTSGLSGAAAGNNKQEKETA